MNPQILTFIEHAEHNIKIAEKSDEVKVRLYLENMEASLFLIKQLAIMNDAQQEEIELLYKNKQLTEEVHYLRTMDRGGN